MNINVEEIKYILGKKTSEVRFLHHCRVFQFNINQIEKLKSESLPESWRQVPFIWFNDDNVIVKLTQNDIVYDLEVI